MSMCPWALRPLSVNQIVAWWNTIVSFNVSILGSDNASNIVLHSLTQFVLNILSRWVGYVLYYLATNVCVGCKHVQECFMHGYIQHTDTVWIFTWMWRKYLTLSFWIIDTMLNSDPMLWCVKMEILYLPKSAMQLLRCSRVVTGSQTLLVPSQTGRGCWQPHCRQIVFLLCTHSHCGMIR